MPMRPEFRARYRAAIEAGLVAAAAIYEGAMQETLLHGYIPDSDYSRDPGRTGATANSVSTSPPYPANDGIAIKIGSSIEFTIYWELGHWNIFTRRFERVEHWREQLELHMAEMQAAFDAAFARTLAAA